MWMTGMGGPFLSYYYVDRTEGPSAKGAHVSDPPTAAELDQVIEAPDHTFRDPIGMGARALTPDEVSAAKLPPRPAWLDLFEPPGTPPPPVPATAATGRPRSQGRSRFILQYACGPGAGGVYQIIEGGETLDVGSRRAQDGVKRVVLFGDDVLDRHAVMANTDALTIEPVGSAKVTVNGTPITGLARLALGDRIDIGATTLIVRDEGFAGPVGPDPSCPGVGEAVWIQDGCSMWSSSYLELVGGQPTVVGTDDPERVGLPPSLEMNPPVRVRLVNRKGKVEFTAVDPARPPRIKGRPLGSGTLAVGDHIEVGDRVFAILADDSSHGFPATPMPSCPEAKVKEAIERRKARTRGP
jgi:hypothetical protein